jgi:hypothetical protein
MIVEERIYTLAIGKAPEYLALYEPKGSRHKSRSSVECWATSTRSSAR